MPSAPKPASLPVMNENFPSLCLVCGADRTQHCPRCGFEMVDDETYCKLRHLGIWNPRPERSSPPASSDQAAMNENVPGSLWKRVLNFIFRSEDFDIFIWHSIIISILWAFFYIRLGQYNGFSFVLTESLPISAYSFFAFILFRAFVNFARAKLDSISFKQQSTTTQGENHG